MTRLLKICGMREPANIADVAKLKPDLMGFIFYPKSKRFVGEDFDASLTQNLLSETKTVGVFVNESSEKIVAKVQKYKLEYAQLHGDESVDQCSELSLKGIKIIKAFGIDSSFDWSFLKKYEGVCEWFLFDTSSAAYGGSGVKFNWNSLAQYTLSVPFFLSGGIDPEDSGVINEFSHPQFKGIDLNSRFEIAPGLKNISALQTFIDRIQLH